jgi:hypothetical protein
VRKPWILSGALLLFIFTQFFTAGSHAAEPVAIGSVGIRISEIPANVADHPYSKVYIVSRLVPGVEMTQRLEVFNTSPKEFKVSLYPGLATFSNGEFKIGEGRMGNTLTSWTKLTPNTVVVKPGASKFFTVTISPPADAASVTQYGVIWAEVAGTPNEAGITSVSRVGIRMYVPVGDSSETPISATDMVSSTNEIIVKKSFLTTYTLATILVGFFLILALISLVLFFLRRDTSERKARRTNEKLLEEQWRNERARRRKIWKQKLHLPENPPSRDQRNQRDERDNRDQRYDRDQRNQRDERDQRNDRNPRGNGRRPGDYEEEDR